MFRFSKGQIQMMETISVLVVFFVLLFLGIYLYFTAQHTSIEETQDEFANTERTVLLAFVPSMPEIVCSKYESPDNCVDMLKLFAFKEKVMKEKSKYMPLFTGFKVVVRMVYPIQSDVECDAKMVNKMEWPDNCGVYTLYDEGKKTTTVVSTPLSLYLPSEDTYYIGKLEVYSTE